MTARTAWPTSASGDIWTAAQFNLYGRDNDLAYWVFQAAGDLAYASSASALARLAIGAAGKVLTSNGSAPAWGDMPALAGRYHKSGAVVFNPQTTVGGSWGDVAGATLTLTLGVTCSILVLASTTGYNTKTTAPFAAYEMRAVVDGVADANGTYFQNLGAATQRNEDFGYIYLVTGITAGARIVKMQAQGVTVSAFVGAGRLIAIAVTE